MRHDQSTMPLIEALDAYVKMGKAPFHIPGHKYGRGLLPEFRERLGDQACLRDLASLVGPEIDSLHDASGCIARAQELIADAFEASQSLMLVNGPDIGLQMAIMSVCDPGDEVILSRNVHASAAAGIVLSGAIPVFTPAQFDKELGLLENMTLEDLRQAIQKHPRAKALLLLSPSHHGFAPDLDEMVEMAHQAGLTVVVDERFGAHFRFHKKLPISGIEAGADFVVQDWHRCLGALEQAAVLHVRGDPGERWGRIRNVFQTMTTTSPSYLIMASLDIARHTAVWHGREMLDHCIGLSRELAGSIDRIKGLSVLGYEMLRRSDVDNIDSTRLTISVAESGLSGYRFAQLLEDEHDVTVDGAGETNLIVSVGFQSSEEDAYRFTDALESVVEAYGRQTPLYVNVQRPVPVFSENLVLSPRAAFFAPRRSVKIGDSVGDICSEVVTHHSSGIPLIFPGEEITSDMVDFVIAEGARDATEFWRNDPTLQYIEVVDERRTILHRSYFRRAAVGVGGDR
jgi:arginine/lysine/ornithine decarboxylase